MNGREIFHETIKCSYRENVLLINRSRCPDLLGNPLSTSAHSFENLTSTPWHSLFDYLIIRECEFRLVTCSVLGDWRQCKDWSVTVGILLPFRGQGSLNHEKEITSNTLKAKKTKFKNVKESKKTNDDKEGGKFKGISL